MQINPKSISPEALELLKEIEGYYEVPRTVNGTLYTGYGFCFYENGDPVTLTDLPLSQKYATRLLRQYLRPYENCVSAVVHTRITQYMYDALVLLAYDIGIRAFCRSRLLTRINSNEDPKQLFSDWLVHANCEGQFNLNMAEVRELEWNWFINKK